MLVRRINSDREEMAAYRFWESFYLPITIGTFNSTVGDFSVVVIIHNKNAVAALDGGDGVGAACFALPKAGLIYSGKRFLAQIFFYDGKYSF